MFPFNFDDIGRRLRSKRVLECEDRLVCIYKPYPVSTGWRALERKMYLTAKERCEREAAIMGQLHANGLNVPELISHDPSIPSITIGRLVELRDLVEVFRDREISVDDKSQDLTEALELLKKTHGLKLTHGDSYLKNFGRVPSQEEPSCPVVHTWDFECKRLASSLELEQVIDVLLLSASALRVLRRFDKDPGFVFDVVQKVYKDLPPFPFDHRDKAFYTVRFGVEKAFFDFFS